MTYAQIENPFTPARPTFEELITTKNITGRKTDSEARKKEKLSRYVEAKRLQAKALIALHPEDSARLFEEAKDYLDRIRGPLPD